MKAARGYWGARSKVYTVAKNTVEKAMQHSYKGRKLKKRDFRALWIQRINAAVRMHGMSYSVFMGKLHAKNIIINRKALAYLAVHHPEAFAQIVKAVQ